MGHMANAELTENQDSSDGEGKDDAEILEENIEELDEESEKTSRKSFLFLDAILFSACLQMVLIFRLGLKVIL